MSRNLRVQSNQRQKTSTALHYPFALILNQTREREVASLTLYRANSSFNCEQNMP